MPIYNAHTIPSAVGSSTKEPEIAEWLKTGPVLGSHKPIHVQRRPRRSLEGWSREPHACAPSNLRLRLSHPSPRNPITINRSAACIFGSVMPVDNRTGFTSILCTHPTVTAGFRPQATLHIEFRDRTSATGA
jgi:hypothetical protein